MRFLLFSLVFVFQACFPGEPPLEVHVKENKSYVDPEGSSNLSLLFKAGVTSISLDDDRLEIDGTQFPDVKLITIRDANGQDSIFQVDSLTPTKILASSLSNITLAADRVMSLIMTDVYGEERVFEVKFSLSQGSVTGAMISPMNASDGDFLGYNESTQVWEPRSLSGLSYMGTWDADNFDRLEPYDTPASGEYWVVSNGGNIDLSGENVWEVGDWAIYNGQYWERIKNSSDVVSFNGRQGAVVPEANDYTWAQIDKTISSLADITSSQIADIKDVDVAGLVVGNILKWDGSNWAAAPDDDSGVQNDSVFSASIVNGSIVDEDISASAAIAQSKISGLTTDLAAKVDKTTTVNGQALSGNVSLDTGDVSEGTNKYFTDARAKSATVADSITDAVTDVAPSQNAVFNALATKVDKTTTVNGQALSGNVTLSKSDVGLSNVTNDVQLKVADLIDEDNMVSDSDVKVPSQQSVKAYVDAQVASVPTGDLKADGSVAMAADFNLSSNKAKFKDADGTDNYVSLVAPAALGSDVTLTLPSDAGTDGYLLKTDGTGNLSWVEVGAAGSVDSTTIANNSIVDADISASAAIAQSKISGLTTDLAAKVDKTTTVNGQALSGNVSLDTGDVSEGTNKYFTNARATAATLSGFATGANSTVTNADSVEVAIEKLQGQVNNRLSSYSESDPQVGSLSSGKWCTSNGSTVNCTSNSPVTSESDPQVGSLSSGKWCTSNGSSVNCTSNSPVTSESDPQVGSLSSGKWCTSNGSTVNCTSNSPLTSESDPQVGSLSSGKWCTSNGSSVNCTSNSPLTSESDPQVGSLSSGKWCTSNGSSVNCTSNSPITSTATTMTGLIRSTTAGVSYFTGGNLGVGTTGPSEKLEVNGKVKAAEFLYSSDMRWKKDEKNIENALDKVLQLRGLYYFWDKENFPEKEFSDKKQIGVFAQEVEKVLPEVVYTDADGFKSVAYAKFTPLLIEAVKELHEENEQMKSALCELKPSFEFCK